MLRYLLLFLVLIGFPVSGFAQFIDKGDYVEVKKQTKLCSNVERETKEGAEYPARAFWMVTSKMRANHTQAVESFTQEKLYDRESGETKVSERESRENYATFFKRDLDHKGCFSWLAPKTAALKLQLESVEKRSSVFVRTKAMKKSSF